MEGVGGLKTNEAYHSKADALLIPEMYFFFCKFTYALFWKCWFCKIRHLFRCACATGYDTGWIRANHIWNASSHLAQQREPGYEVVHRSVCRGDAFNPSALSDCSTGPSPPLAHAKSTLSPSRASAGCLQPGLFGRFRSICEQTAHLSRKFEHNVKHHLSMSSKLRFRVPRWKRNDTFLRAFVKRLLFFASHMASAVGNVARDSTSWARRRSAQWFKTARYVADINNRQTTESISVVLVSIESVSSGHLVVKNNLTPEGIGLGARSGRSLKPN